MRPPVVFIALTRALESDLKSTYSGASKNLFGQLAIIRRQTFQATEYLYNITYQITHDKDKKVHAIISSSYVIFKPSGL